MDKEVANLALIGSDGNSAYIQAQEDLYIARKSPKENCQSSLVEDASRSGKNIEEKATYRRHVETLG